MVKGKLNRAAVVASAAEVADRDGVEAITMSGVARHLGIQPASLYSHVRDLAALLEGVQQLALVELADEVGLETAGRSGRAAMMGLAEAHRRYARRSAGRWAALQRPGTIETAQSVGATRLVGLNFAVLAGYGIGDDELVHATRFVGACINGYLSLERSGGFEHRTPSTDASWERVLSAIDVGLAGWPNETTKIVKPRTTP